MPVVQQKSDSSASHQRALSNHPRNEPSRRSYCWIYGVGVAAALMIGAGVAAVLMLVPSKSSTDAVPTDASPSHQVNIESGGKVNNDNNNGDPTSAINDDTNDDPTSTVDFERSWDHYMCNISMLKVDVDTSGNPILDTDSNYNQIPSCNHDMIETLYNDDSFCCNVTFSSLIDEQNIDDEELVIPCGTCVIVDIMDGATLDLPHGLNVDGMLYFPPTANLEIQTTHVIVVGMFKMETPVPGHHVKIHLYGETDVVYDNVYNLPQCGSSCNFGSKPIAVIGGRLEVEGYPTACPSWEKLQAIAMSEHTTSSLDIGFPCVEVLRNADFEQGASYWRGNGNLRDITSPGYGDTGNAMAVTGRTHWSHGIYQVLADPACVVQGQEWRVQAQVKLFDEATLAPVTCDPAVRRSCPMVRLYYRKDGGLNGTEYYFFEYYDYDLVWKLGEWNELNVVIPIEIDEASEVQLHFCGGPTGSGLEIDNISMTPVVTNTLSAVMNQLVVSQEAAACWPVGSELLVTSHTRNDEDRQIVTVESVDTELGILTLSAEIEKPLTMMDDSNFAVEVALLNRPIVFEAQSDPNDDLIGGHLIIYWTSTPQHLQGVETRNFGQQGILGRYPIHFHFCQNSPGSIVAKNVVRDSNQRCYVIHQTNQVIIEDNVALDVFGHCYFLEDGEEINNVFVDNLGAGVKASSRLLSQFSGKTETDDKPSVFWISNPKNYYYGNIAAGGESTGFWFETTKGREIMDLGAFDDNEAHSMQSFGFTSYPPGWQPTNEASIHNLKVYRNVREGMFLHNTRRLTFYDGIVADNGQTGVFVLQGDSITFVGTKFIGRSSFDVDPPNYCLARLPISGIKLDATRLQEYDLSGTVTGTTLIDVEFINLTFETTGCHPDDTPIEFTTSKSHTNTPTFDAPHTFVNVTVPEGSNPLEACGAEGIGVDDIIIEIVDDPAGTFSSTAKPGFLVNPQFSILSNSACTSYSDCLDFCVEACMRTVRFFTNAGAEDCEMVVTPSDGVDTLRLKRKFRTRDTFSPRSNAVFNVALSAGTYDIHFEDAQGQVVFPDYVLPIMEAPPTCSNHVELSDITIIQPSPREAVCSTDLIRNGRFDSDISGWSDFYSGTTWDVTGALRTTTRQAVGHYVSYYLNVMCIQELDAYDISLDYRLLAGDALDCNFDRCPDAKLEFTYFDPAGGSFSTQYQVLETLSTSDPNLEGFRTLQARWSLVTQDQARADKVQLVFNVYQGNVQYLLDNVQMIRETLP